MPPKYELAGTLQRFFTSAWILVVDLKTVMRESIEKNRQLLSLPLDGYSSSSLQGVHYMISLEIADSVHWLSRL